MARSAPPPYRHEGPHALWHYSEDPTIEVFRPQRVAEGPNNELAPRVWAIDTRHAPSFWFPRDCPRGCAWPGARTTDEDRDRFFGHTRSGRLHVIELGWLEAVRACELWAYELPMDTFFGHSVGGYWVSEATVEPLRRVAVGDLLARHVEADIELRLTPTLWTWWTEVDRSTLEFSGSRMRNCAEPMPEELAARR